MTTTEVVLVYILPAVIAGGVGWEALQRLFVRAKVYKDYRGQNIVALGDLQRRQRVEAILTQQDEPTAIVEVEWWNSGRRASSDTKVVVRVPGRVVNCERDENNESKATDALVLGIGTDVVEARKGRLNPRAWCRLVVGFQVDRTLKSTESSVLVYEGDREVSDGPIPGSLSGWIVFPGIAAMLAIPYMIAKSLEGTSPAWVPQAVWAVLVIGGPLLLLRLSKRWIKNRPWPTWGRSAERPTPSPRPRL